MYRLPAVQTKNAKPWDIPFEERQKDFLAAAESGSELVVIISDMEDPATFRYRGYNIYQLFEKEADLRVVYFFTDEIDSVTHNLNKISCVVISRSLWTARLQSFIDAVKQAGIPYIYDIDDLVFDVYSIQLLANSINLDISEPEECAKWFQKIARTDIMAKQADGFISTNTFLGDVLENKYQKPSRVIQNFFNDEQLAVSDKLLAVKQKQKSRRPFTIGYFSGSPSHVKDFEIAAPELVMLMEEYSDIRLSIAGHMVFPQPQLKKYLLEGRIQRLPYVDFLQLQKFVAEVDVNAVPLKLNTFTHCKSELKYFEAALVGTPTLASPSFTFEKAITSGENGFLCKQGQWYQTIKDMYIGAINTAEIAKNAHAHTIANYGAVNMKKQAKESYAFYMK